MSTITTKSFVASRINWLGIILILEAAYTFVSDYKEGLIDFVSVLRFCIGLSIVVIRTVDTYKSINRLV